MKTATKDSIITLPNPNLRSKSSRVGAVSVELKKIIDDMKAATLDWEKSRPHEVGVALAAIQIDQPYRIIIVRNNPDDKSDTGFSVFINPKITKLEGDIEVEHEGCLSVKDIYGKVPRYTKVRVSALDETGQPVKIKAEGFLARVLQHEVDHTNGIVFPDRIKNLHNNLFRLSSDGKLDKINDKDELPAGIFR